MEESDPRMTMNGIISKQAKQKNFICKVSENIPNLVESQASMICTRDEKTKYQMKNYLLTFLPSLLNDLHQITTGIKILTKLIAEKINRAKV